MNTLHRELLSWVFRVRGLMALGLLLVGAACSKAGTYTYVDVYVSIDRQTVSASQLAQVISCEFQVLGADVSEARNLRCPEKRVPYDLGTFQWTSGAANGTLQFRVRTFDGNHMVLGEGTSETIPVSPGKHLETSVLVVGVDPTTGPDAGDDTSSPVDGGIETGPTDGMDATSADVPAAADAAADTAPSSDAAPDGSGGPAGDASPDNAGDASDASPDNAGDASMGS